MRTLLPLVAATLAIFLLPSVLAYQDAEVTIAPRGIESAAQALDQSAACEGKLAQSVSLLAAGGSTFSCNTACLKESGGPVVCTTLSGLGPAASYASSFAAPVPSYGPLGFSLWLPSSARGGGFDAAPYLSAFDPYGSYGGLGGYVG